MSPSYSSNQRSWTAIPDWVAGDVAFLRTAASFSERNYDELVTSNYLPKRATCHPVIILAVRGQKAIITTISAYNSEENCGRAPWQQSCHSEKSRKHFFAFDGSEKALKTQQYLKLAKPYMALPKPKASWVYAKNFFVVPFSVLGIFTKAEMHLKVHDDSLRYLKEHMRREFLSRFNEAGNRLHGITPAASRPAAKSPSPSPSPPSTPPPPAALSAKAAAFVPVVVPKTTSWAKIAAQPVQAIDKENVRPAVVKAVA